MTFISSYWLTNKIIEQQNKLAMQSLAKSIIQECLILEQKKVKNTRKLFNSRDGNQIILRPKLDYSYLTPSTKRELQKVLHLKGGDQVDKVKAQIRALRAMMKALSRQKTAVDVLNALGLSISKRLNLPYDKVMLVAKRGVFYLECLSSAIKNLAIEQAHRNGLNQLAIELVDKYLTILLETWQFKLIIFYQNERLGVNLVIIGGTAAGILLALFGSLATHALVGQGLKILISKLFIEQWRNYKYFQNSQKFKEIVAKQGEEILTMTENWINRMKVSGFSNQDIVEVMSETNPQENSIFTSLSNMRNAKNNLSQRPRRKRFKTLSDLIDNEIVDAEIVEKIIDQADQILVKE